MTRDSNSHSSYERPATRKLSISESKESAEDDAGDKESGNDAVSFSVNYHNNNEVAKRGENEKQMDGSSNSSKSQDLEKEKSNSSGPKKLKIKIDQSMSEKKCVPEVSPEATTNQSVSRSKPKARRKSSGVPEHKSKKLNKKASKAKMTHINAKPGEYFYVRLKGYPLWPAIVCDETMLPSSLLKTRPVTAARADGTYREDFMDGGPKAKDRSFPVMYLFTNEFGWIPNYDLVEIDFDEVANVTGTMRKDLAMARQLAAKRHGLNYFKDILKSFMETRENERLENEKSREEKVTKDKKEILEKKKTPKKSQVSVPENNALEDKYLNLNVKRSAEEPLEGPPKKRTTIKLNTKAKIDTLTPKPSKSADMKKQKSEKIEKVSKVKKIKILSTPNPVTPTEPELTTEEKRKEILFLRHKLQKGLLTKDQELKSEDMKLMSEFIEKLEAYTDLEVSIIRQTKINKVLKAILKLQEIPLEHEYRFKPRSQSLLDEWNKLFANDSGYNTVPSANGTKINIKNKPDEPNLLKYETKSTSRADKSTKKYANVAAERLNVVADDTVPSSDDPAKAPFASPQPESSRSVEIIT
ncbi:putative pwwp domain-containing protein [Golovinomyces cichoracearum]|uniref:Putative pwwp domain-containing protein n=1 Tax=Golovinomyces cichoracearum TaxID=62708 RepID=A0A420J4N3_9PEZI|nr:putative pwwp domain-containing protein [Golovinomyces cichoracearum]